MRLLSFVPFGCRAGPVDDAPPADHAAAAAAGDAAAAARRRRRRIAANRSALGAAAAQWSPSLGDIYEEYDSTDAAKAAAAGPVRVRKAASWDVARVLPRARSHEYRYICHYHFL
jgi:MYXO-CTERM domain-containing protein